MITVYIALSILGNANKQNISHINNIRSAHKRELIPSNSLCLIEMSYTYEAIREYNKMLNYTMVATT